MSDILKQIITRCRDAVHEQRVTLNECKAKAKDRQDVRPFLESLRNAVKSHDRTVIIAEIKRGSPAKGLFAPSLSPAVFAAEYEAGGATCLSVLTEPDFFHGSLRDLVEARNHCSLPILQKDFIVDTLQIYQAATCADAILLIARCLEHSQLEEYHALATKLGLDVLVEVFDESDMEKIERYHFPLIGINHRNLATMSVDLERSCNLASRFDFDQMLVAASGIKNSDDIETLTMCGMQAFLIGESLSRSDNRVEFLRQLVGGRQEDVY